MSYSKTQDDLANFIQKVEQEIQDIGFNIDRSEIIGYLLDYFVSQADFSPELLIGDIPTISRQIIDQVNTTWPVDPWHGGKIDYQLEIENININKITSSNIMKSVLYFHYGSLLGTLYVLILIIMTFALALIEADPSSFVIFSDLNIFIWYPIASLVLYRITKILLNNKQLRTGIDDLDLWFGKVKKVSYIHIIGFSAFCLYILIGSIATVRIGTSTNYTEYEANRIPIEESLTYILNSAVFFFLGLRQLWHNSSLIPKENLLDYQISKFKKSIIDILISIQVVFLIFILNFSLYLFGINRTINQDHVIVVNLLSEITFFTFIMYSIFSSLTVIITHFLPSSSQKLDWKKTINTIFMLSFIFWIALLYNLLKILVISVNSVLDQNLPLMEALDQTDEVIFSIVNIAIQIILIAVNYKGFHKMDGEYN